MRRKGEPLPRPGEEQPRRTRRSEHLEARPSAARRQRVVHRRNGPRIRMGRRSARPGHVRDAGDPRRGRADPRHLQLLRPALRPRPRAISPSPAQRPPNPRIDIAASADIEDVTVNINVGGSANNPQIAFTSSPALPQDEMMARILFGGSVDRDLGAPGGPARRVAQLAARRRRRASTRSASCARRPASTGCGSSAPTRRPAAAPPSPPASTSATTSIWRSSPTPAASPPPSSRSLCPRR